MKNLEKLSQLIKEELSQIINEVDYEKIQKSLQELHTSLFKPELGRSIKNGANRAYTTLTLETVSKIIETPISHLMLYFLNKQNALNESEFPCELKMQLVYFFENRSSEPLKINEAKKPTKKSSKSKDPNPIVTFTPVKSSKTSKQPSTTKPNRKPKKGYHWVKSAMNGVWVEEPIDTPFFSSVGSETYWSS